MVIWTRFFIAVIASAAACPVVASDWCGFRGLEKDGRSDAATVPLTWSPLQNVAWKTVIPGRGHSSPILAADAVYVTTGYPRVSDSSVRNTLAYALLALAVSSGVMGVGAALRTVHPNRSGKDAVVQCARFFLFHLLLLGILVVVLYGPRLLNPDDENLRDWALSILVVLLCLILTWLVTSVRARQQFVAGIFSFVLAAVALLILPDRKLLFALGSMQGVVATGVCLLPLVLGVVALVAHRIGCARPSVGWPNQNESGPNRVVLWHYVIAAAAGYMTTLVLCFLILYRAAGYQMPDRHVWNDRVAADISNWWVAAGCVLLVAGSAFSCWRFACHRRGQSRWHTAFPAVVLSMGILFAIHVMLGEGRREFVRAVVCLDRQGGRILWTCEGLEGRTHARSRTVTNATPTPVTDGQRIYAYFGADGLMCVDTAGQLLWKNAEAMPASRFGVATSPVLKDNVLVVVRDVETSSQIPSSITAYDALSGKRLWRQERKSHKSFDGYSTPLVRLCAGEPVVIVHGWFDVRAYDLITGAELWTYPVTHEAKHLVASPVCDDERLYITGATNLIALDLSKLGTDSDPVVWSTPVAGEKSSTPVVVKGLLFLMTEIGSVICLDAQTGQVQWSERLKGRFYASAIAAGDKVLLTNEAGRTTMVAVDRKYRLLATNDLEGSMYASMAPRGDHLFVRTTECLYCLEGKSDDSSDSR